MTRTARARADTFVLRGTPKTYVKTAESGNRREHAFCGHCGTREWSTNLEGRPQQERE